MIFKKKNGGRKELEKRGEGTLRTEASFLAIREMIASISPFCFFFSLSPAGGKRVSERERRGREGEEKGKRRGREGEEGKEQTWLSNAGCDDFVFFFIE